MMPPIVPFPEQKIYGDVPFQLPVYSMAAVERKVLADTLQQYDVAPMYRDPVMMELDQFGLHGLSEKAAPGSKQWLLERRDKLVKDIDVLKDRITKQVKKPAERLSLMRIELQRVNEQLGVQYGPSAPIPIVPAIPIGGTMPLTGLDDLGADTVKVTVPQPVKTSTVYAVIGLSVLAVAGSIALWAYYKGKK